MSKQYNKAEKRQRRQAYLKRKKDTTKAKAKTKAKTKSAAPTAA
ncbi:MAG TPA: hypothetical protein VNT26_17955 [Candidatus Sulfotelmatobacter sp.]|nr:hypothetical protein [Candidatus Sulfotelmatobacter sp.]HWI56593.1 hypothetical protein [Bacillota bacterium]